MPVQPYADEWRYLNHPNEDPKLIDPPDEYIDHSLQTTVKKACLGPRDRLFNCTFLQTVWGMAR